MDREKVLELAKEAELARQFAMEVPFVVDRLEQFAALIEAEVRGDEKPVAEHDLKDKRCECCGYMTYHREHMGCIKAAYTHPAPAVDAEQDANRYRWLKENSARFSWNPSRFNESIVDGFAAFGTGYLGYSFEQAIDLAMKAALAAAKEAR